MQKQLFSLLVLSIALSTFLFFGNSSQNEARQLYQQWKVDYGHLFNFSPFEDQYRFKIFEENLKAINEHNSKTDKSFTMGVNKFTVLTQKQFVQTYLSSFPTNPNFEKTQAKTPSVGLNIDWVQIGAVSPFIKDQGSCYANYAFSAVGGIEGLSALVYQSKTEFSAQELVDCSSSYGNQGCNGGSMGASFNFVKARGINSLSIYPYTGKVGTCKTTSGFFKISGYVSINTCAGLDNALTGRPISVAVDSTNFKSYKSGAFDNCGTSLNYGALLVGATDLYYRLKMSWGTSFGENGYMRLLKSNNVCGICQQASYPIA